MAVKFAFDVTYQSDVGEQDSIRIFSGNAGSLTAGNYLTVNADHGVRELGSGVFQFNIKQTDLTSSNLSKAISGPVAGVLSIQHGSYMDFYQVRSCCVSKKQGAFVYVAIACEQAKTSTPVN